MLHLFAVKLGSVAGKDSGQCAERHRCQPSAVPNYFLFHLAESPRVLPRIWAVNGYRSDFRDAVT